MNWLNELLVLIMLEVELCDLMGRCWVVVLISIEKLLVLELMVESRLSEMISLKLVFMKGVMVLLKVRISKLLISMVCGLQWLVMVLVIGWMVFQVNWLMVSVRLMLVMLSLVVVLIGLMNSLRDWWVFMVIIRILVVVRVVMRMLGWFNECNMICFFWSWEGWFDYYRIFC